MSTKKISWTTNIDAVSLAVKTFGNVARDTSRAISKFSLNERNRRKERFLKWLGYEVNKRFGWYNHPTLILPRVSVERLIQTSTRAWLLWFVLTAKEYPEKVKPTH